MLELRVTYLMITNPSDIFNIPVSIVDLPAHIYSVTPDTETEMVVEQLEKHLDLPGVMIVENGKLLGVITRLKLFERLGHRFGVELFLRKPIIQLKDLVRSRTQPLQAHLCIDEAIQYALSRPAQDVFDPIIIQREDDGFQLLDINVLLLAQSRAMASLSNVVGNLDQIDQMVFAGTDREATLGKILNLLRHVVPYHQAAILATDEIGMKCVACVGYKNLPVRADGILHNPIYEIMLKHRQAVYVPNAHQLPTWQGMEELGYPVAWMGVPFLQQNRSLGMLSVSRNVERPFTNEERETNLAFAQRIINLLLKMQIEAGQTRYHLLKVENHSGIQSIIEEKNSLYY